MDLNAYREELKLRLTGNLINLELEDSALDGCINSAFRQVQRYIDTTRLVTIPYTGAIDLNGKGVSSVSRVYRAEGYASTAGTMNGISEGDPMYMASWQMMSGSNSLAQGMNQWA